MSMSDGVVHELRSRAEALLPSHRAAQARSAIASEDVTAALRELRLHEIELELQNAALRETQLELELSRAKYRELYEHAPIPYLSLAEDSTIMAVNEAALALLQSTREALIGTRFSRYVAAEDAVKFALHQRAFTGQQEGMSRQLSLEIAGGRREVRLHSIRSRDGACESLMMITDLSEKQRLAQTLEAHAFTSAILDAAGLIAVLDLDGRIVQLNQACSALLDEPSAATGRPLWDVFASVPEQRLQAGKRLRTALTGIKPPAWEGTFSASDGQLRHIAWSFARLAEQGAKIRYVIASGNDLTALKSLEAQLVVSQRLAPMGQLAAGVGHEINNPLAYVKSSLELAATLLDRMPKEQDKLKHTLDVALEGVDRIRLIVDDLRVLSSHDVRAVESIDVRKLLDSCVQLATNEIRHRARLLLDYGDVPNVAANAGRLSQVFINLLVNAAHSIEPGHAGGNEIAISVRTDAKGGVTVVIRDSGSGIAADKLPHIFEPFFTTKRIGQGTGLGLAICHGIIAELGGQISVESAAGRGTTFRVWLPAASAVVPAPALAAPKRAISLDACAARNILVIDDEARITESFALLLGEKHCVRTAATGREALELCAEREFDVIFCDLRMPEMGGDQIYRALLERSPAQARRIVFMTGSLVGVSELEAFVEGEVAVLRKPFSAKDLNAALAACFDKHGGAADARSA
jgi:PAS domain S-box-containing protein